MKISSLVKKLLSPISCWLHFPVIFYSIPGNEENDEICIAYAGHNMDRARTWAKRVLGQNYKEIGKIKTWIWQLNTKIKHYPGNCALLMVESSRINQWYLNRLRGFKLSMWIQNALDTSKGLEHLRNNSFRLKNEIPRLIKKFNLDYTISEDIAELEWFINVMHIPFIKGRHGDTAFLSPLESIIGTFEKSELIFITFNGEKIAGVLLHFDNNIASLRYIGILDNNHEYFKVGCIGALYYFAIERAIERGYPCLNIGGSSPFLNDGLTYFKFSFKTYSMPNTYLKDHYIKMIFLRNTQGIEKFLHRNGFVFENENGERFKALFINSEDTDNSKKLKSWLKAVQCGGIKETHVYASGDHLKIQHFLDEHAPESESIKLIPFDALFDQKTFADQRVE